MSKLVYALFLLLFVACVFATRYEDCGSQLAILKDVHIKGCDTNDRCSLIRGKDASISIKLSPKVNVNAVTVKVAGKIAGVELPFKFPYPNGCSTAHSGLKCPLAAGQDYEYAASLPVQTYYPTLKVDIIYKLLNGNGKVLICAKIPAKLTSK